jgi:SDR family mycofactocin-dependent oxidoreductase
MNGLQGKVAFITGAARGQGRSHAIRLAQEGVDIIGIDICDQVDTVSYPLATRADLNETVSLVEKCGGRMLAATADVRDFDTLKSVVSEGFQTFGRVDIVIANAGILIGASPPPDDRAAFRDLIDINLVGVWNTIEAALPRMLIQKQGGSIVLTSSTAGLKGAVTGMGGGAMGYAAAKTGIVGLMRKYANLLAPESIRVNSVHPTGVDTPMLVGFHEEYAAFVDRLPEDSDLRNQGQSNPMPVSVIDPVDVSNAIAWLVSDEARYVTGVALPIDAGFSNK